MKAFTSWVMGGFPNALFATMGFAVLGFILPPLTLLASAIPALVVLRMGEKQGFLLAVALTVLLGVLFSLLSVPPKTALLYALPQWFLPVLLATWLRWKNDWQPVLQLILIIATVSLVLVYAVFGDLSAYWLETLGKLFRPALEKAQIPEHEIELILPAVSSYMTGAIVAGIVFSSIIVLFIARYMQAVMYNPGGFETEFRELKVGQWPAFVVLAAVLFSMVSTLPFAREMILLVMILYFFQGIAIVHALAKIKNWHPVGLVAIYAGLLVLTVPFGLMLAGLGLIDTFLDIRKRFSRV